jgi:hypothetical protein
VGVVYRPEPVLERVEAEEGGPHGVPRRIRDRRPE